MIGIFERLKTVQCLREWLKFYQLHFIMWERQGIESASMLKAFFLLFFVDDPQNAFHSRFGIGVTRFCHCC